MESFFALNSNRTNSFYDEQNDSLANLSSAMNRSKLLLNEMVASPSTKSRTPGLIKTSFLQSKSLLSQSIASQDAPIDEPKEQKSSIYSEFKMETNKNIDEELNLIDLVDSYSNICHKHSHILKEKIEHLNPNRNRDLFNSTVNDHDCLDKEKYVWSLVSGFFQDEQDTKNQQREYEEDMDTQNSEGLSETDIVQNLEKRNPFVRRLKLVIEWLEKIAYESDYMKKIKENLNSFTEKSVNWEHTLHNLKSSDVIGRIDKSAVSGREFVDELDPDAPIRLAKSLHDLDQEDEYKLMEYIFAFIRAGDLKSARDFCQNIGQSWRAATLEGFRLFGDKNYLINSNFGMNNQKQIYLNEGNFNRDIWRLMVHKMIKDENFGPYEKAVYASLAGFVTPVLPVCRNFADYVWIYFKALYNQIIEKEIRQRITNREFLSDPDDENVYIICGKSSDLCSNQTIKHIFDRIQILIKNSSNIVSDIMGAGINTINASSQIISNLKSDANKPFSIITKYIILAGIDGFETGTQDLLEYLKNLIVSEQQSGFFQRFSSHLALFYRAASYYTNHDTFVQILDAYSQYLIDNNYKELIAYYVSSLSPDLQIKRYSTFLQTVTDNKERMTMLKFAKERNMNIQAITQNIVDNLSKQSIPRRDTTQRLDETGLSTTAFISQTLDMFSARTGQILTDEDKTKINAIDWIAYDPSQRIKLLEYANFTMRYFLLERQFFEATKAVFSKIPVDTITLILNQYNLSQTSLINIDNHFEQIIDNLPNNITNLIKEYLCFKEYIESINLYNEWFDFFHKDKPIRPASRFESTDLAHHEKTFAEKMSHGYQIKEFEENMSRWYSKALKYCDQVKAKFSNVLKFPFGGWMCDLRDEEDDLDVEDEEIGMDDENMNTDANETGVQNTRIVELKRRRNQMHELRKLYLPNICFILLDMLTKMDLNKELIRLGDLIASENYKLYSLFDNQQLRILLNKIADSSIVLLDSKKDYLGY